VLIGNEGVNQLLGHTGADTYRANGGNDTVFANSGSRDLTIDCGEGTDAAVIDFAATIGDPAPVGCESIREAKPNEYRTQVEEPPPGEEPPPPAEEPPTAPPAEPPPPTTTTGTIGTGQNGTGKPGSGQGGTAEKSTVKPDRTPPRTKLLGHPAKVLHARGGRAAITLRFAASERSHFECKLDARAFHSCRSPFHARLAAGRHTFRVYAIDAAGNRDRTPSLLHLRVIAARPR
jgi:hypothetical protein